MDAWWVLAPGIGSAVLGGFYVAFSLVVPALWRRPAGEASSTMIAVNQAAVHAPFLVLFFGTALACLIVVGTGTSRAGAPPRVLDALASLAGWVLTMAVNVPLNRRLVPHRPQHRRVALLRPIVDTGQPHPGRAIRAGRHLGLLTPLP